MLKLFSGKIQISIFFVLLLWIISVGEDAFFICLGFLFAALHETAHILILRKNGADIKSMKIYPFGMELVADTSAVSYRGEIAGAAAGPLVNLALAVVFFVCGMFRPCIQFSFCTVINLLFFAVNIFPVKGLDGGRILFSLLMLKLDVSKAYRWFSCISVTAFGLLCILALALIAATGYNLSLLFICIYILFAEYIKGRVAV